MTGLSRDTLDVAATIPEMPAADVEATAIVRRSSRAHTGRSSLNVEEMVRTAGAPENMATKRKRAPVSKKIPVKLRGISKKSGAIQTRPSDAMKDEDEESPAVGIKHMNGPVRSTAPAKRRKVSATAEEASGSGIPTDVDEPKAPHDADNSATVNKPGQRSVLSSSSNNVAPLSVVKRRATKKPAVPATIPVPDSVASLLRPKSYGAPLVWAEGRQALCETLPYYRAYNSGAHTSGGLAHGFLLSSDHTERSFMDEEVVITRAGGHCGRNETGEMGQITDHSADEARIMSFRNNMSYQFPLVLIVGKQNTDCPTEIPHEFCVMDWFQVTDIWAEMNQGKVCFKFRFEKLYRTKKSWWAVEGSPNPDDSSILPQRAFRKVCMDCLFPSTQIFDQGWICLNEQCPVFWQINGNDVDVKLTYNSDFLKERTAWPKDIKPPYDLVPQLPQPSAVNETSIAYDRVCWKGIVCPQCGRCTSRRHWDAWRCETEGCGFIYAVPQPILSPRAVMGGHEVPFTGHAVPRDQMVSPVIMQAPRFDGGWRIHTYELCPGNTVTHFHASESVNGMEGGANGLFKALQQDNCMGLQRFPMKMHTGKNSGKGEVLAQHFALNYGMPYKYVVAVDSKGFNEAPAPIIDALKSLEWAARQSVHDNTFKSFNELLAVGYFEDGKMGFHDDGEKELGPTVATLSLGASATMSLRMKSRYFTGLTKNGNYDQTEPVLPGSCLEAERKALNRKWGRVPEAKFSEMQKALYSNKQRRVPRNGPVLLTLHLAHGDVVIMHGKDMQKYFEHQVAPSGKMRFALTCRFVKPELVDPAHHWKGVYSPPVAAEDAQIPALEDKTAPASKATTVSDTGNVSVPVAEGIVETGPDNTAASAVEQTTTPSQTPPETQFPVFF
ncbi:hypothetical protein MMC11_003251 [Xylographa trunciseda]|nr:hypothetical protein [Xylographa trunciseda]